MVFAGKWMNLEIDMLNEVSQSDREGEIVYDIPYIWNWKRNGTKVYKTERDSQT